MAKKIFLDNKNESKFIFVLMMLFFSNYLLLFVGLCILVVNEFISYREEKRDRNYTNDMV